MAEKRKVFRKPKTLELPRLRTSEISYRKLAYSIKPSTVPAHADFTRLIENITESGKLTRSQLRTKVKRDLEKRMKTQKRNVKLLEWGKKAVEFGYEAGKMTIFSPAVMATGYLTGAQKKVSKSEIAFEAAAMLPIVGYVKPAVKVAAPVVRTMRITTKLKGPVEAITDLVYLTRNLQNKALRKLPFTQFRKAYLGMLNRYAQISDIWAPVFKGKVVGKLPGQTFNEQAEYVLKNKGDISKFVGVSLESFKDELFTLYSKLTFVSKTTKGTKLHFSFDQEFLYNLIDRGDVGSIIRHISESGIMAVRKVGNRQLILDFVTETGKSIKLIGERTSKGSYKFIEQLG